LESYTAARPLTQRLVSCVVVTERKRFKAAGFSVHARPAECLFWWDRTEMPCKICKGKCINLRKQDHALLICIPSIARCLTTLHASSLFLTFFLRIDCTISRHPCQLSSWVSPSTGRTPSNSFLTNSQFHPRRITHLQQLIQPLRQSTITPQLCGKACFNASLARTLSLNLK